MKYRNTVLDRISMWFTPHGYEISNAQVGDKIKTGNTISISKEEAKEIYLELKRLNGI